MVSQKYRWDFIGLSTDTKPTSETSDKVVNGSTYYCSDTSKLYVYCNGTRYERKPLGGGGGGGGTSDFNQLSNRPKYKGTTMTGDTNIPEVKTYTAGSNITISGNEISATDTKYTAGTNVSISDQNVISATDTTYSAFTGTDGTAAGSAGLVPAPATSDTDKYLKSDGSWATVSGGGTTYTAGAGINITNAVISATNTGKARVLTTDDYNWPATGTATSVALWLLEDGYYTCEDSSVVVCPDTSTSSISPGAFLIGGTTERKMVFYLTPDGNTRRLYSTRISDGVSLAFYNLLGTNNVVDNLTTTSTTVPLSANQGKVLKDLVDSLAIRASGAPTTSTVGSVGTLYEDTTNGKLYQCTAVSGNTYTWTEIGAGGGSGPTVVQTIGTSTTDVMSQKAVGDLLCDLTDYPTEVNAIRIGTYATNKSYGGSIAIGYSSSVGTGKQQTVAIGPASRAQYDYALACGASAKAQATHAMAVGDNATASATGSVALGANATASTQGEVNIGTSYTSYGYNSSNYRLLTGLYDGQSAHDAATVAQGNTLATSAPTTSTVGVLGQLYTDTTNMHTYQCTAISGDTYTWTQRW